MQTGNGLQQGGICENGCTAGADPGIGAGQRSRLPARIRETDAVLEVCHGRMDQTGKGNWFLGGSAPGNCQIGGASRYPGDVRGRPMPRLPSQLDLPSGLLNIGGFPGKNAGTQHRNSPAIRGVYAKGH